MPRKPSLSRRSLLRGAAGAGAAGLAAGALGTSMSAKSTKSTTSTTSTLGTTGPLIVHVRDARTGDIEVFAGSSQTSLRDRNLAARIAGAIRQAG